MSAGTVMRQARLSAGLTLRELATRSATSHSTLSAYEAGRKEPRAETLERIVRAAGFALDRRLSPRVDGDFERGKFEDRGDELAAVLELAELFPARHEATLTCPVFGRRP
ncbi:MAG: helix-turn-helix domain-containing protein [Acidimicrobiales bacterium]